MIKIQKHHSIKL